MEVYMERWEGTYKAMEEYRKVQHGSLKKGKEVYRKVQHGSLKKGKEVYRKVRKYIERYSTEV